MNSKDKSQHLLQEHEMMVHMDVLQTQLAARQCMHISLPLASHVNGIALLTM